jgi:hypothetical protein
LARVSAEVAEEIIREWERARRLLEPVLREAARAASEAGLEEVASYIVRGGKRFRGFLVILVAEALGGTTEDALSAAAAIELVHSASLAIDDIIDKDRIRRGSPVAWIVYGVEKTVLATLLMIPVAQRMVIQYGLKALTRVVAAWERTVRGEILDYLAASRLPPYRYLELVDMKTGSLFALAASLGAIAAGRADLASRMEEYGSHLGRIYQVADDASDYYRYIKGMRPKLDPSEELFERWAVEVLGAMPGESAVATALGYVARQALKASMLLEGLPEGPKKRVLRAIPRFMAEKLVEEAGLTLPEPGEP